MFDSNKGQEWGYNSNMFEKDRLAPKIIKLADSESSESKDSQVGCGARTLIYRGHRGIFLENLHDV